MHQHILRMNFITVFFGSTLFQYSTSLIVPNDPNKDNSNMMQDEINLYEMEGKWELVYGGSFIYSLKEEKFNVSLKALSDTKIDAIFVHKMIADGLEEAVHYIFEKESHHKFIVKLISGRTIIAILKLIVLKVEYNSYIVMLCHNAQAVGHPQFYMGWIWLRDAANPPKNMDQLIKFVKDQEKKYNKV